MWPNSSLSMSSDGNRRAVHLDERLRPRACDCEWMARATSSLPVPFSPVMSTRAGVAADLLDLAR